MARMHVKDIFSVFSQQPSPHIIDYDSSSSSDGIVIESSDEDVQSALNNKSSHNEEKSTDDDDTNYKSSIETPPPLDDDYGDDFGAYLASDDDEQQEEQTMSDANPPSEEQLLEAELYLTHRKTVRKRHAKTISRAISCDVLQQRYTTTTSSAASVQPAPRVVDSNFFLRAPKAPSGRMLRARDQHQPVSLDQHQRGEKNSSATKGEEGDNVSRALRAALERHRLTERSRGERDVRLALEQIFQQQDAKVEFDERTRRRMRV